MSGSGWLAGQNDNTTRDTTMKKITTALLLALAIVAGDASASDFVPFGGIAGLDTDTEVLSCAPQVRCPFVTDDSIAPVDVVVGVYYTGLPVLDLGVEAGLNGTYLNALARVQLGPVALAVGAGQAHQTIKAGMPSPYYANDRSTETVDTVKAELQLMTGSAGWLFAGVSESDDATHTIAGSEQVAPGVFSDVTATVTVEQRRYYAGWVARF